MFNPETDMIVLVDGHHGIYTFQVLMQSYTILNVHPEDKKILLSGPDTDGYTESSYIVEDNGLVIIGSEYYKIICGECGDLFGVNTKYWKEYLEYCENDCL